MIDLASMISPGRDHGRDSRRGRPPRPSCAAPRPPGGRWAPASGPRARYSQVSSSVKPGRVVEAGQQVEPPGPAPDLLGQLPGGGDLGRLAVHVALAGRHSSSSPSTAARYWRTISTVPSAVSGTTTTAPGMVHDVPLELLAVRALEVGPRPPGSASRGRPRSRRAYGTPARPSTSSSRGARPSARCRAAPTRPANSGWGLSGPALELRVGLGADPEGVAGQLDELDQPVVGRGARADQAGALRAGPGSGG